VNTEDLIVSLAADAQSVKPLPSIDARAGRWIRIALISSVVLALAFGIRHDLNAAAGHPSFVLLGVLGLMVAVGASVSSLRLSVPGVASRATGVWPVGLLGLWIALLVVSALSGGASLAAMYHEPWHWACISRVSLLAVIPSGALWIAVGRGYVLDRGRSAFLSAIAGGAIAALALQFVCPVDRGAHLLVSHLVPVLVLSMAAALVQAVRTDR